MQLKLDDIKNKGAWQSAGIKLPKFDTEAVAQATAQAPVWVHFGAGNIFRGYIARLGQVLLDSGLTDKGIIAAETFDAEIIEKIYKPHDNMTLLVSLRPDGSTEKEVVASITEGLSAAADMPRLEEIFCAQSLQMVSFTITEKGYSLWDMTGALLPVVEKDMAGGPEKAVHAMSIIAALMLKRYKSSKAPLALVSMDNCSHNGEKLRNAVCEIAQAWVKNGFADNGFAAYLADERVVSFPWSMIDKITPRPDAAVQAALEKLGLEAMAPVVTSKNTFIAPFVNAEVPEYLVVEDNFPNGRPPLDKAGVYFTTRDTVNKTETMKVTTCLNPLHTALAVFGCLLSYDRIYEEMRDADLKRLVEIIGYKEGLPVVVDPGIVSPEAFLREVIEQRLPNPFIPDMPQRIATDSSQKVRVRFGETIKAYAANPKLNVQSLVCIPLAIAGWLRYLLAKNDELAPMELSSDPLLAELEAKLAGIEAGKPESYGGQLKEMLKNAELFGIDLVACGLGEKIEAMFIEMLEGKGAVRRALKKYTA